jgi:hypothetical protein
MIMSSTAATNLRTHHTIGNSISDTIPQEVHEILHECHICDKWFGDQAAFYKHCQDSLEHFTASLRASISRPSHCRAKDEATIAVL